MNVWLKILLFLLIVVLLSQCEKDEPNPEVTIPDNNFLNALIELGVDTNGDGIISPAEAEAITFLDVSGDSISNLTGIEKFVNLDTLKCYNNQLTSLDVSKNTVLTSLICSYNQLTSLDVSNNTALKHLFCPRNQLTNLDVSKNAALERLDCFFNQLTSLDVSNNTALEVLWCFRNQLTTLDVSNNTTLEVLACEYNQLPNQDVSNCTALRLLDFGWNQLTSLDFSNNTALDGLGLRGMPSLYKVCVWEMPFPPANVSVDTTGSPNVYFTTDCNK